MAEARGGGTAVPRPLAALTLLRRREVGAAVHRSDRATVMDRPPTSWVTRLPAAAVLARSPDSVLLGFARTRAWGDTTLLSYRHDGEQARAAMDGVGGASGDGGTGYVLEAFDVAGCVRGGVRDTGGAGSVPRRTLQVPLFASVGGGAGASSGGASLGSNEATLAGGSGPDHSSVRVLVHECPRSGALAVFGYSVRDRDGDKLPTPYYCTVVVPPQGECDAQCACTSGVLAGDAGPTCCNDSGCGGCVPGMRCRPVADVINTSMLSDDTVAAHWHLAVARASSSRWCQPG